MENEPNSNRLGWRVVLGVIIVLLGFGVMCSGIAGSPFVAHRMAKITAHAESQLSEVPPNSPQAQKLQKVITWAQHRQMIAPRRHIVIGIVICVLGVLLLRKPKTAQEFKQ